MSNTPESDAAKIVDWNTCCEYVDIDFARELERENAQIKATLREYLALSSIDGRAERQPLREKIKALCG